MVTFSKCSDGQRRPPTPGAWPYELLYLCRSILEAGGDSNQAAAGSHLQDAPRVTSVTHEDPGDTQGLLQKRARACCYLHSAVTAPCRTANNHTAIHHPSGTLRVTRTEYGKQHAEWNKSFFT